MFCLAVKNRNLVSKDLLASCVANSHSFLKSILTMEKMKMIEIALNCKISNCFKLLHIVYIAHFI